MLRNFLIKKLKVIYKTLLYSERHYQGLSSLRKWVKTDVWLMSSDIFRFSGIWAIRRIFIFVKNLQIYHPQNDTFWIATSVSELPAKTACQNLHSFCNYCGVYTTILTFRWAYIWSSYKRNAGSGRKHFSRITALTIFMKFGPKLEFHKWRTVTRPDFP